MSINGKRSNRLILALILALFCYLGLYTWNARTGYLDTVAENSGLEVVSFLLSPIVWVKDQGTLAWNNYIALVGVAEENTRLRKELQHALTTAALTGEAQQELLRLRNLLHLPQLQEQPGFAARVLARRFGPNSPLQTITINKGFSHGATVGTPVVIPGGVVGQVLRAAPHASTVLLITDPSFKLAVVSQKTRTPAIAVGTGPLADEFQIDLAYVAPNAKLEVGEILITAGMGSKFPKGIPVGQVTSINPSSNSHFKNVTAKSLVSLKDIEEVLVLMPNDYGNPLMPPLVGPPRTLIPPVPLDEDTLPY